MRHWLRQLIDVRKGERARTAAMFTYIFVVIAVLIVVKSVRQSLFLHKFGAADLPYVYALVALTAGAIATIYQKFSKSTPIHRMIVGSLVLIIACLTAFRVLIVFDWSPLVYVLYVWVAIYGVLATVQFWTFANYLYDPRQAKRLFAVLGVGATMGGIAGGYITKFTVPLVGTENLLLVCGVLLVINIALILYLWRSAKDTILEAARARRFKDSAAGTAGGGFRIIWESRYLKLVMSVIAISIVISTVIDNQFSFIVAEEFPEKEAKTAFFGIFFTWLGWSAFLTQFFLTAQVLRRFGIGVGLMILPAAFFLGSAAFVILPILATGLAVKIADGTFRYTIHKASLELLYLPIPAAVKNKTKAFIDMFTDRGSKGVAAALVLLMTTVLGLHYKTLSWVLMGLALSWIVVAVATRRAYVQAFRDSLMRRRLDDDELLVSPTDAATIGSLADALSSGERARVAKTLDLIEGVKASVLVGPLVAIAHGRDENLAVAALDRLAEQGDTAVGDGAKDLIESRSVEIAARALRLACGGERPADDVMREHLEDNRSHVRVAGVVAAARWGGDAGRAMITDEVIERTLTAGDDADAPTRCLMAGILGDLPSSPLAIQYLSRFLDSQDEAVCRQAIVAAGKTGRREFVGRLIRFLGNRKLRYLAREALVAYGESVLGTLEDYLRDAGTSRAVRQYLPRVLEQIGVQRSVDILIGCLDDGDEKVRFSVLRGLSRLRARHPDLDFAQERIFTRLEQEIRKAYRYQSWQLELHDVDDASLLKRTLRERSQRTIDRVFRLLAMQLPPEELYSAFRALGSPAARVRANAIEYLDNVLKAPLKSRVLGLVEEAPTPERVRQGMSGLGETYEGWPHVLATQTAHDDDWLSACALYTVWATREKPLYGVFDSAQGDRRGPIAVETVARIREWIADEARA